MNVQQQDDSSTANLSTLRRPKIASFNCAMDTYRYSVMNMQDSADVDLDALLNELCALESQLKDDKFTMMLNNSNSQPPAAGANAAASSSYSKTTNFNHHSSSNFGSTKFVGNVGHSMDGRKIAHLPTPEAIRYPENSIPQNADLYRPSKFNDNKNYPGADKFQPFPPPSANSNANKLLPCINFTSTITTTNNPPGSRFNGAHSPDNDSAFCDNLSVVSADSYTNNMNNNNNNGNSGCYSTHNCDRQGGKFDFDADCGTLRPSKNDAAAVADRLAYCRTSQGLSVDSSARGSMTTPSPTQLSADTVQSRIRNFEEHMKTDENLTAEEKNARLKAEKIKIALEKMKEASIKKIYVKIFTGDENSKSLLVDERWTIYETLKILADKNHVTLSVNHSLVEYHPDLHMERLYEDHERLVENILMWSRDSNNKLYFIERPVKYDMFKQPHLYLLREAGNSGKTSAIDKCSGRRLIEELFNTSNVQPPPIEGVLYLKQEGKKAWRKRYFVLRASGLYFSSVGCKNKLKSSKDLVCLAQLDSIQIYNGIGWKKKYKAPTDFGIALKHPQIQIKASHYIRYLCAEDEKLHSRWIAALRMAKNGRQLYDNYQTCYDHCTRTNIDDFQAADHPSSLSPNLKTSTSLERLDYYKESVVVRPRLSYALTLSGGDDDPRRLSTKVSGGGRRVSNSDGRDGAGGSKTSRSTARSNSVCRTAAARGVKFDVVAAADTFSNIPIVYRKSELDDDVFDSSRPCLTAKDRSYAVDKNFPLGHSRSFEGERDRRSSDYDGPPPSVAAKNSTASQNGTACCRPTTTKRRPNAGAPRLPLTRQTRQIVHGAAGAAQKLSSSTLSSSDGDRISSPHGTSGSDNLSDSCLLTAMAPAAEADSDEEDNTQMMLNFGTSFDPRHVAANNNGLNGNAGDMLSYSASMTFSTAAAADGQQNDGRRHVSPPPGSSTPKVGDYFCHELFPPPPSPLPLAAFEDEAKHFNGNNNHDRSTTAKKSVSESDSTPSCSANYLPCTCPRPDSSPVIVGHQVVCSTNINNRRQAPPPPKRSETTRLTTAVVLANGNHTSTTIGPYGSQSDSGAKGIATIDEYLANHHSSYNNRPGPPALLQNYADACSKMLHDELQTAMMRRSQKLSGSTFET